MFFMRCFDSLHLLLSCSLLATSAIVSAQEQFESPDFNVTEALLKNGVDVSDIPALSGLVERSSVQSCAIACSSLVQIFGSGKVITQANTQAYEAFTSSYWSQQQAAVDPRCIFRAATALDVSTLVLLSRLTQCPFAVKSGGHAAFAGASSIEGGITVDLKNLNELNLSADKTFVAVGPGNVWYDVYSQLEPHGLAVIGGRVSNIGVGGLLLGGGISFFSNQYGWACDNVLSFTIVTASGVTITASPTSHSSLYWALRGGGSNFGIVIRFTLRTIPQGQLWGGGRAYLEPQFPAALSAFVNLGNAATQDGAATQIMSFTAYHGMKLVSADLAYANPNANIDETILKEWREVPNPITDTQYVRTLTNLTQQFSIFNPKGLRETYWVATYKLDLAFTSFVKDVFYEEVVAILDAEALVPAATLQVITEPQLAAMQSNGGNPLGLSAQSGPLLLLNLNMMWMSSADDARILEANRRIVERTVEESKRRRLGSDFLYMNYASQFQDVIESYGSSNEAKLRAVAKLYDPTGVFQRLVPGGFKLGD